MGYAKVQQVTRDSSSPTRDCIDSGLPGERQHYADGQSPRCEFHRGQRERWVDLRRKALMRGIAHPSWEDYATPRETLERGVELDQGQATTIVDAAAFLLTAQAPLSSLLRHGAPHIPAESLQNLMDAVNEMSQALRPITRRRER